MAGWRTIQLGADVPINDLAQAVECFDADLVALSASLSVQFETVKSTIQAIKSGRRGDLVKILVGGLAFADQANWLSKWTRTAMLPTRTKPLE
jgi:methanogenic corrinoid protein MtbC1